MAAEPVEVVVEGVEGAALVNVRESLAIPLNLAVHGPGAGERPLQQLRLRYDIFKHWEVEAQTGTESGMDIYYKIDLR